MSKDTYTKLCMVGDFHECYSCDGPCGTVHFVTICFEKDTNDVVWINTKLGNGQPILCPEDINGWSSKAGARQHVQYRLKEFIIASEGPLYKLSDFCKGGAHEESIRRNNMKRSKEYKRLGLTSEEKEIPEKILLPERKDY